MIEEVVRLRRQNTRLEEENRWLKDQLRPPGFLPSAFPLTDREEALFKALISRPQWTREALLNSLYLGVSDRDLPDLRMVDVLVCKVRRKLKPFGLEIQTYWGKGFGMTADMRARAEKLIADETAKEAAT